MLPAKNGDDEGSRLAAVDRPRQEPFGLWRRAGRRTESKKPIGGRRNTRMAGDGLWAHLTVDVAVQQQDRKQLPSLFSRGVDPADRR